MLSRDSRLSRAASRGNQGDRRDAENPSHRGRHTRITGQASPGYTLLVRGVYLPSEPLFLELLAGVNWLGLATVLADVGHAIRLAIASTALTSLNSSRPLRSTGKRPTICGKHDDDRGCGIAQRAEKRTEVRRVD